MNIKDKKDIKILSSFLAIAGNSLNFFTFYKKRDLTYIQSLDCLSFGFVNESPIAYGHLDYISGKINDRWLGLCVAEEYVGKGIGKKMLLHLENKMISGSLIKLSVYKKNTYAVNFYKKNEYIIKTEKNNSYYMQKEF